MIATLKVITILATAFFGIFGSLVNFRDRTGRITRNGWIGLVGVIVAGLSAACLQLYSEAQQEKSTLTMLTEINRILHPLPGLRVSYSLRPDWQKEGFRKYLTKVEASLPPTGFGTERFPKPEESPLLDDTVCSVSVELFFFREPIDPARFEYKLQNSGEDLRIQVSNPCRYALWDAKLGGRTTGGFSWYFDRRDGKLRRFDFEVADKEIDSTSNLWRSNSKITSLQDLVGAQLVVQLHASGTLVDAVIDENRWSIELTELITRLRNGIVMGFDADNLKRFRGGDGFPAYSFIFPQTMEELIKATRYDQFKNLGDELYVPAPRGTGAAESPGAATP
jgi:hypothetical protein